MPNPGGRAPNPPANNLHSLVRAMFVDQDRRRIRSDELATRSGYSKALISKWRKGDRVPTIQQVEDVANVLGFKLVMVKDE